MVTPRLRAALVRILVACDDVVNAAWRRLAPTPAEVLARVDAATQLPAAEEEAASDTSAVASARTGAGESPALSGFREAFVPGPHRSVGIFESALTTADEDQDPFGIHASSEGLPEPTVLVTELGVLVDDIGIDYLNESAAAEFHWSMTHKLRAYVANGCAPVFSNGEATGFVFEPGPEGSAS